MNSDWTVRVACQQPWEPWVGYGSGTKGRGAGVPAQTFLGPERTASEKLFDGETFAKENLDGAFTGLEDEGLIGWCRCF